MRRCCKFGKNPPKAFFEISCYGVSTFTPRSNHISTATFTHNLLLAVSLAAGRRSSLWVRAMAGLLLFVDSFINRCYLLVSGSVRVRVRVRVSVTARARVSAMVTVRDRDRI